MWRDSGMPSGFAYAKRYRTCKSCVGTDYCRYGLGDSIGLASRIEKRFQGVDTPAKLKLATAGCPRNCSEAMVKDVGAVAVEGGKWEIYVGGAAGAHIRKGDVLCTVDSPDDVLRLAGRFIQYYRENAKYLERTYAFVPRVGIEKIRAVVVDDSEGIAARLDEEMQRTARAYATRGRRPTLLQRRISSCRRCWRPITGSSSSKSPWGPVASIPAGEGRTFPAGTKRIAVFRTRQGALFASQADCPHRGGPLADGLSAGAP